jgi:plasmid stabilization system protein ParE
VPRPSILFHPEASRDYEQAYRCYFSRSRSVAADFEREIARALRLIAANPLRWPQFDAARRLLASPDGETLTRS